jgi:hypothetical protein
MPGDSEDQVVEPASRPSEFDGCSDNLRQLGVALHAYHYRHNCFPRYAICDADDRPLLSWRVAILPFLDQRDLYEQFRLNEPWDSPHNLPLANKMPIVFRCPIDKSAAANVTNYVVAVGQGTYFPPQGTVKETDVTDGAIATVMVGELSPSKIVWTKPEDLTFDGRFMPETGFTSAHDNGWQVLLGDGSARFMNCVFRDVLLAAMTIAGGEDQVVFARREYSAIDHCGTRLDEIGRALHRYYSTHGCFPPYAICHADGTPLLSWRVAILPFVLDPEPLDDLYKRFRLDEPWDSPHNLPLAERMPSVFRCPKDSIGPPNASSYVVVTGMGTFFPLDGRVTRPDVKDGLGNTVIAGEMVPNDNPWTKPELYNIDECAVGRGRFSSAHSSGGWNVLMGDMLYEYVDPTTDPKFLRAVLTIAGGEPLHMHWNDPDLIPKNK